MNGNLLSYLRNLVDIEKSCYEQKGLLENLKDDIHSCKLKTSKKEEIKEFGFFECLWEEILECNTIIGFLVMALPIPLYIYITKHDTKGLGFLKKIEYVFIIILIICLLICFIRTWISYNDIKTRNKYYAQQAEKTYEKASERERILTDNYNAIKSKYNETLVLRNNYYSINIIYPKYRNYACIASILEYFQAGRCSTLGEAYNLLENDIKFNVINTKLDSIIDRLDAISANQSLLYNSINQANRNIRQMSDRINSMSTNIDSKLASIEYTNNITSRNVRFLTALETYKMLK